MASASAPAKSLLLIDNEDSFTFNVLHGLEAAGAVVTCASRHLPLPCLDAFSGLVIGPGPGHPKELLMLASLIDEAKERHLPTLGICLGHQLLGLLEGAPVARLPQPVHGKQSALTHNRMGLFKGMKKGSLVTRYHSLHLPKEKLPDSFIVSATTECDIVMAIQHKAFPIYGLQFHPDSYASEEGAKIFTNFLGENEKKGNFKLKADNSHG